jgi:3-oxoacyl-[acyl-carrier-protein] synthase II
MKQKIAITKAGCISSYGTGKDDFFRNINEIRRPQDITLFETEKYKIKKAFVMNDFDPKTILGEKGLRNLNRNTLLIISALKKDFDDEINYFKTNGKKLGLTVGTAFGSLASISDYELEIFEKTPRKINPMGFANTVLNSPTSRANIWFELTSSSTTISSGGVSGAKAVEFSINQLVSGNADAMLCGASEEINMQTFLGYYLNGFLSDREEISAYSGEKGTILSEGCAVVLLETPENAKKRNAEILGFIEGYGTGFYDSTDNMKNFSSAGVTASIRKALDDAGILPDDIDLVVSSANGIKGFDNMEEKALLEIFGEARDNVPVIPLKAIIGENIGAFNIFQMIFALQIPKNKQALMVFNCDKTHKRLVKDNNYQINTSKIRKILLNCSSECGNHSAIIINLVI